MPTSQDNFSLHTQSIALLRRNVCDTFQDMLRSLDNLANALKTEHFLMSWASDCSALFPFADTLSSREKIIHILKQYEYLPTQAPREIIVCAGFVGASDTTLHIVKDLNLQKDNFKKAILALKKITPSAEKHILNKTVEDLLLLYKREDHIASNLRKMGMAKLHLKQCYRKIPILSATPLKISWTWANTRSIKKISVLEAEQLLKKRNTSDEGILLQLKKLASLNQNEPLAIVQNLAPHLRANLVMGPNQVKGRLMVKGPVPIFFPATLNQPWPEFTPPKKKTPKNKSRVIRNDVRLDPLPFLPAIRVHRYLT